MSRVKFANLILAILLFALLDPLASAQESVMMLNHRQLGSHERFPVRFDHELHAGKLDCVRCHHDYDEYRNNSGGEDKARSCAECHGGSSNAGVLPLKDAFHSQCMHCHQKMRAHNRESGPVMCGECHTKR